MTDEKKEKPELPSFSNLLNSLNKPESETQSSSAITPNQPVETKSDYQSPPSRGLTELQKTKLEIGKLLANCEKIALEKLEAFIESLETKEITFEELMGVIKSLADVRLVHEWTEKLKQEIRKNPSKLTPINVGKLSNKLKGLAQAVKKEQAGDNRESKNKIKGSFDNLDLPDDEKI